MKRLLAAVVVVGLASPCGGASAQDLVPGPRAYVGAQAVAWISSNEVAVGRWDGSVTIFDRRSDSSLRVTDAFALPSGAGVELVVRCSPWTLVTSNDSGSLVLWRREEAQFRVKQIIEYDSSDGVATAGVFISETRTLITGHSAGVLLWWELVGDDFRARKRVDVRAQKPINPYGIHHVRGIVRSGELLITGSEDGDLCVVRLADGVVASRLCYDSAAKFGINAVSACGEVVLVGSCAKDADEANVRVYEVKGERVLFKSGVRLAKEQDHGAVFAFGVSLTTIGGKLVGLATTEGGTVWVGSIQGGRFVIGSSLSLGGAAGPALAVHDDAALVVGDDEVQILRIAPK